MKQFLRSAFNIGLDKSCSGLLIRLCESTFYVETILWSAVLFVDGILFAFMCFNPELYSGQVLRYSFMYALMAVMAVIVLIIVYREE